MKIDFDNIKSQYEEKTTGDLFDLHKSRTLSDKADEILGACLQREAKKYQNDQRRLDRLQELLYLLGFKFQLIVFLSQSSVSESH